MKQNKILDLTRNEHGTHLVLNPTNGPQASINISGHGPIVDRAIEAAYVDCEVARQRPPRPDYSMFEAVKNMNECFGNPAGNPDKVDFVRLGGQAKFIKDELKELMDAIGAEDSIGVRDAVCDLLVFTMGVAHLMGADLEADMLAVYESNMSKFIRSEEDEELTSAKYTLLGVKFQIEDCGNGTKRIRCTEDHKDAKSNGFRAGKILKSASYHEPAFDL